MKVLLKPHVDLLRGGILPCGQFWRGEIGTNFTSQQWNDWFRSYTKMFLRYAKIAQEERVEAMSMNCELYIANMQTAKWKALVKSTRSIFPGKLTTASNWAPPAATVLWWDVLDFIGVDAYWPLKGKNVSALVKEWTPILNTLETLSKSLNKKVAFTEIGFPVGNGLRNYHPKQSDYEFQNIQYQAVFEATKSRPFFLGAFWWNWETDPGYAPGDDCFTPQWKLAQMTIMKEYNSSAPQPTHPNIKAKCYGYGKCTS